MSPRTLLAAILATALLGAALTRASAAALECSSVGTRYDFLFVEGNKRVTDLTSEYKALPANAPDAKRTSIRYMLCEAAGEVMGELKFLRALANECGSRGEPLAELQRVLKEQFDTAGPAYQKMCS